MIIKKNFHLLFQKLIMISNSCLCFFFFFILKINITLWATLKALAMAGEIFPTIIIWRSKKRKEIK